jgi:hypothetical protein
MELTLSKINRQVFFVLDRKVISARIVKFNMFDNNIIQNAVVRWATESYPSGITCQAHELFEREIDAYKELLFFVETDLMDAAEKIADIAAVRKDIQKKMQEIRSK